MTDTITMPMGNKFSCILGDVVLTKEKSKEPFVQIPKDAIENFSLFKHGPKALMVLYGIFDFCKNPKNKNASKCWNKARIKSYFKSYALSGYEIDEFFIIYEKLGYLVHNKRYPFPGCNRITHEYIFYSSPKLNPFYNSKKGLRKVKTELRKLDIKKATVNELLEGLEKTVQESTSVIKEEVTNSKKPKKENTNVDYVEKIEYDHDTNSAITMAKTVYDKTIFNPLTNDNNLFNINTRSENIINYKNVALNNLDSEILLTDDPRELATVGFNIILKGMMKYNNTDIEDNIKHADNLVKKFGTYESTKTSIDSLWKFRNFNKLFTNDFNRALDDGTESVVKVSTTLYPSDTDKEYSDDYLYILDDSNEVIYTQRELKNRYFLNFCFMIGSYLYYIHHVGLKEENMIYSNGMLSYQDINAFTRVFEKYPYLIYLPIDDNSMNLLGELYNQQQEQFKNN